MINNANITMNRIKLWLCVILFTSTNLISAQGKNFLFYSVRDGLNTSQTTDLCIDSKGYLNIGTYGGGINIFDGLHFTHFNTTNGLCNNNINVIKQDSKGNLWIATESGLSKYDGSGFTTISEKYKITPKWISALSISTNDDIWFCAGNNVYILRQDTILNYTNKININNNQISFINAQYKNELLVGVRSKVYIFDISNTSMPKIKDSLYLANAKFYTSFLDREGNYWFGSNKGLLKYSNKNVIHYSVENQMTTNTVYNIYQSADNDIWLATDAGITIINKGKFKQLGKEQGFTDNICWAITGDNEKNIWLATSEGLYKYPHNQFEMFSYNDKKKLDLWFIFQDSDRTIWLGSDNEGLLTFNNGKIKSFYGNYLLNSKTIRSITEDTRKRIWVSTDKEILIIEGDNLRLFNKISNYSAQSTMCIYQDSKNNIWFGTYRNGLFFYDGRNVEQITQNGENLTSIISSIQEYNGNIWIATDVGLIVYSGDSINTPEELNWSINLGIDQILVDKYNNLWVATYEKGVFVIRDGNLNDVRNISLDEGLNDNAALALVPDKRNNLWVGTNKGINKIDLTEFNKNGSYDVIPFFYEDGLPGIECVQFAAMCDSSGYIYFATIEGLLKFDPEQIFKNNVEPDLRITDLSIITSDFEKINYSPRITELQQEIEPYYLPYNTHSVSISFHGLSYSNQARVKYSYKLNGQSWSEPTSEQVVKYLNLDPGNHRFSVKAVNSHGVWTAQFTNIDFYVDTPYYNTITFYIVTFLGIILFGYLLIHLTFARIKRKNKLLEERIEERLEYEEKLGQTEQELRESKNKAEKSDKLKSEFLAQMSHEIRTPINSILSFSSLLKEELWSKVSEELKEGFDIIGTSGHRLLRTIDLILNMSQVQSGSLEIVKSKIDLVDLINLLITELKHKAILKQLDLKLEANSEQVFIDADMFTTSQIFVNLIDNAIKYTKNGSVTVRIIKNGDKVIVEVEDTGIGISEEFQKVVFMPFLQEEMGYTRKFEGNGLGLALVKSYCDLNDAHISLESKKNIGTIFRVSFNYSDTEYTI